METDLNWAWRDLLLEVITWRNVTGLYSSLTHIGSAGVSEAHTAKSSAFDVPLLHSDPFFTLQCYIASVSIC